MSKSVKSSLVGERGGGGCQGEYSGNALFLFFITRGRGVQDVRPLARITLWMVRVERCLVQLSTLHSKKPFFQPQRKSSTSSDPPIPFPKREEKNNTLFSPSAADPQLLPACFPWLLSNCFMWLDWSRLEVAPAPVLRRHLFSSGTRVCWCWQGGAEEWRGVHG